MDKTTRKKFIETAKELGLNVASAWPTEYLVRLVLLAKHSQMMKKLNKTEEE